MENGDGKKINERDALTALVIAVMLKTAERIGNEVSSTDGHYGVTFFLKKHMTFDGDTIQLRYVGKSGVLHEKSFTDELIAKALKKAIKNSPSKYIFTTSDGFKITPERVNRRLREYDGITGKGIRGWLANDWIVKGLEKIDPEEMKDADDKKRLKLFNKVAKSVAGRVGHGKATLKKHYLLPELEENFVKGGKIINLTEFYSGGEVDKK